MDYSKRMHDKSVNLSYLFYIWLQYKLKNAYQKSDWSKHMV